MRNRIIIGSGLAVVFGLAFLIGNILAQPRSDAKKEVVLGYVESAPISRR
ncbi:hypothetical protein [Pseudobdellovibrio exovorus]|uniref:Uncharacterized protein n=1 Tax=Pseudobdellovibrio exovorus JSS TaxID=1184267 RepID=M4VB56_9BACT|nr:hypothetical protein [Pseudobdellovibrio exovorus]AGH95710.1 hypothetical protein A11Q_1494 [Pseudobdellovibrio exovorus JSS]